MGKQENSKYWLSIDFLDNFLKRTRLKAHLTQQRQE